MKGTSRPESLVQELQGRPVMRLCVCFPANKKREAWALLITGMWLPVEAGLKCPNVFGNPLKECDLKNTKFLKTSHFISGHPCFKAVITKILRMYFPITGTYSID